MMYDGNMLALYSTKVLLVDAIVGSNSSTARRPLVHRHLIYLESDCIVLQYDIFGGFFRLQDRGHEEPH